MFDLGSFHILRSVFEPTTPQLYVETDLFSYGTLLGAQIYQVRLFSFSLS